MASENLDIIIRADGSNAEKGIGGVSDKMGGLKKMAGIAAAGAVAVGVAMAAFGKASLDAAAAMETQEIAFKTLLGSGEKAGAFIKDLQQFAAKTPFEFKGLAANSQQLLNMGFKAEQVIPIMTRVGDAVSAAGGDPQKLESTVRALTQIQAKGKLSAEEMMQLAEAGTFSWTALATQLGVSVSEAMSMATKGRISSQEAIDAFMENSKTRFDGAMVAQSSTFTGLMSTLKDTWDMFLTGQGKKLLDWAKGFVIILIDFVQNTLPKVVEGLSAFVEKMASAFPDMNKMGEIWTTVKNKFIEMATNFEQKTGIVAQLKSAFARLWSTIEETLMPAFAKLWEAMQPLMPLFQMVAVLVGATVVLAFKLLIEIVTALLQIFAWLLAKGAELAASFLNDVKPAIEVVTVVIKKIGEAIEWVVGRFNAMKDAAISAFNAARNAVASIPGAGLVGITASGKADGGHVTAGKTYMVGERGPEMFVPGSSGNIVPNESMGGAMEVRVMDGANISVRNDGDLRAIVDAVSTQLARTMQSQRNGLATA